WRFDGSALQNVGHSVACQIVAQIQQGTNNARVAPGTVLDSHLHHQRFDVVFRARSAGTTAGAPIVLSSDQLSVPSQQSPRGDDRCDLRQRASAEPFGSRREPAALVVRETKSATAELLAQHPILLAQIVDCLLLLLIHPARDGNQHEPKRVENAHCSTVSWALCIVFNAFDFLDNTRSIRSAPAANALAHRRIAEAFPDFMTC